MASVSGAHSYIASPQRPATEGEGHEEQSRRPCPSLIEEHALHPAPPRTTPNEEPIAGPDCRCTLNGRAGRAGQRRPLAAGDEIGVSAMDMHGETNCPDALKAQEGHILSVLGEGPARVEDGRLLLTGRGGVGLIYREDPAD